MTQRNVQYSPSGRRSVRVKDLDDPMKSVGMTLRVHWADGFTLREVRSLVKQWWPAALEIQYD